MCICDAWRTTALRCGKAPPSTVAGAPFTNRCREAFLSVGPLSLLPTSGPALSPHLNHLQLHFDVMDCYSFSSEMLSSLGSGFPFYLTAFFLSSDGPASSSHSLHAELLLGFSPWPFVSHVYTPTSGILPVIVQSEHRPC